MGKAYFCSVGHGDCTVIQGANQTFLIDCHDLESHARLLPSSKRLRGVFVTHQHYDHYSGLRYLKDHGYSIDFLFYSPYERRHNDASAPYEEWTEFNNLKDYFSGQGTQLRIPYRQGSFDKPYWDCNDVKFWMLGPFHSLASRETREIHDASLVIKVHAGDRKFLITGDASDSSLNLIASNTTHYCDDLLRASHHGSNNNADLDFIKGANADYTVVSTKSGVFPNVPGTTAMQRYRNHTKKKVFRTDEDGTVSCGF